MSTAVRPSGIGLRAPSSAPEALAQGVVAVRFASGEISSDAVAALANLGARQVSEVNPQGAVTFAIPLATDPRIAASRLRGVRGVIASGPVVYRQAQSVIPNDPLFNTINQWDMYTIQTPNAWMTTVGSPGVKIAVLDTGFDSLNADLAGKVDASIVFDQGNGRPDNCASAEDHDGHGTDVSGIAAADTNNAIDVAGVSWGARLLEARVFPYGKNPGASTQDIAAAINWAVGAHAKVINLSLGSSTPDDVFEEPAVASAIAAGVIVVAASGNDGLNRVDYPAADPGVIAVGASAYKDLSKNTLAGGHEYVASYSNFGTGLTLVAPGGDPNAAQTQCTPQQPGCIDYLQWIENLDSWKGPFAEEVGLFAGTSQAAPHVAGAVALMATKYPALTPAQALSILKSSADKIVDPHQGAGRLNVLTALNQTP
jgi:serine protease